MESRAFFLTKQTLTYTCSNAWPRPGDLGAAYKKPMPQLLPFFFVNQLFFAFAGMLVLVYVCSKYILPLFTELSVARVYITKL